MVVPQLGGLHDSWHLIARPDWAWVGVAVALTFMTYLAASGTYFFLAFKRLHYGQLVLVQLAAMFVNKLLPGGIGALGANYAYLRHRRYSTSQAASTVAANNLTGLAGHVIVLAISLVVFSRQVDLGRFWHEPSRLSLAVAGGVAVLILAGLAAGSSNRHFVEAMRDLRRQLHRFANRPGRLLAALSTSISLTLCNVLCLASCTLALGIHLPFVVILLVFSVGVSAATATPTPGGLGGFEAGLFGGFVAYHVAAPAALAAALLYRSISYWLPLAAGATAFLVSQERGLFSN